MDLDMDVEPMYLRVNDSDLGNFTNFSLNYEDDEDSRNASNVDDMHEISIQNLRFAVEGIILAFVAIFGILGNMMNMLILLTSKLDIHPYLCKLLVLLVIFDSIFLVCDFGNYSLPMLSIYYKETIYPELSPKFLAPFSQIALTGSVCTIVAITVERYWSCCVPHKPPRDNQVQNWGVIIGIIVWSVVINTSRFLELEKTPILSKDCIYELVQKGNDSEALLTWCTDEDNMVTAVRQTDMRMSQEYKTYYLLLTNVSLNMLVPSMMLMYMNLMIHRAVRKREQFKASLARHAHTPDEEKRDMTVTRLLISIVGMFLFCQSFKIVVVIYEVCVLFQEDRNKNYPLWVEWFINLNHIALAFNAGINIVIYLIKDKKFREACLNIIPCVKWMMKRIPSNLNLSGSCASSKTGSSPDTIRSIAENGRTFDPEGYSTGHRAPLVPKRDIVVDVNGLSFTSTINNGSSANQGLLMSNGKSQSDSPKANGSCENEQELSTV